MHLNQFKKPAISEKEEFISSTPPTRGPGYSIYDPGNTCHKTCTHCGEKIKGTLNTLPSQHELQPAIQQVRSAVDGFRSEFNVDIGCFFEKAEEKCRELIRKTDYDSFRPCKPYDVIYCSTEGPTICFADEFCSGGCEDAHRLELLLRKEKKEKKKRRKRIEVTETERSADKNSHQERKTLEVPLPPPEQTAPKETDREQ